MPHKGQNREPSANSSKSSNPSTPPDDNSQKSDKVDNEDIIGSYFKPRRATELLNQSSRLESSVFTTWRDFANKTKPRSSEGVHSPTIMSTFSFPHSNWLNGNALGMDTSNRRPLRLEALPLIEKRRKNTNLILPWM
ncbi:hypothetical protein PPYR_02863 [Photinus pyralis]|uniref:Uncharacterized protein n=1 Tax=Photinus pyralis TaxID=7054 RepID=A0A1Y1KPZ2_PHOPY|nr:hypothetical protein PPYR_02863 [Photinus pyralis]